MPVTTPVVARSAKTLSFALLLGIPLGIWAVLDPYLAHPVAHAVGIADNGQYLLEYFPYQLTCLLLLALPSVWLLWKFVAWSLLYTEKTFLISFLLGMQIVALVKFGRIDVSEAILMGFMVVLLLRCLVEDYKFKVPFLVLLNLLFFGSLFLSSANAGMGSVLDYIVAIGKLFLLVFLIPILIHKRNLLYFALKWLVIFTTLSAAAAIAQEIIYVLLGDLYIGFVSDKELQFMFENTPLGPMLRVPAFFGHYKPFNVVLALSLVIVFNYFVYRWPKAFWERAALIGSALIMFAAYGLTFSKDGYVALAVGIGLAVLLRWPNFTLHFAALSLLGGVLLYLTGILGDLQKDVAKELSWGEQRVRVELAREGIDGFFRHPWIGIGSRFANKYTTNVHRWPVHNAFIEGADGVGIIGMTFYMILFIVTTVMMWATMILEQTKEERWIGSSLLAGFVSLIVQIQFHPAFLDKFIWFYMGLVQAYYLILVSEKAETAPALAEPRGVQAAGGGV